MRIIRDNWAGVWLQQDGHTAVIDLLHDLEPLAQWVGPPRVPVVPLDPEARADVALVTHLHRDHADAQTISKVLAPGAELLRPAAMEGEFLETAGTQAAEHGLREHGVPTRIVAEHEVVRSGPFTFTAWPAADGNGDPQVHWVARSPTHTVVHAGDTLWHGGFWRLAQRHGPIDVLLAPINEVTIDFPHRQPGSRLPAVMSPEQAVAAAHVLGARQLVPIHYGLFHNPPAYDAPSDVEDRLRTAAQTRGVDVVVLAPGAALDLVHG